MKRKILLLLANGFEMFEASVYIDVFGWNLVEGDGSVQLFTAGITKEVNSSFGQKLIVDHLLSEINLTEFDALAIPGGFEEFGFYKEAYHEKFLSVINSFNNAGKLISSICTGALPIGRSGALNGRNGTTYRKNPRRQEQLAATGVKVIQEPVVVDANIITSWDPSTALTVAFKTLEKMTSLENVTKIRELMGFL